VGNRFGLDNIEDDEIADICGICLRRGIIKLNGQA
jgi:hypothetical protein